MAMDAAAKSETRRSVSEEYQAGDRALHYTLAVVASKKNLAELQKVDDGSRLEA